MTYCKCFDNSGYHHQCIAIELQWSCCRFLLVIQENSAVKKTQKAVSVVTQWREAYVVTWLSWIRASGDGPWRHEWRMKLCFKLKMHRGIDGMFAFSSGLCSWINKDSRICSHRQLLSGLWKSTRWSGLACKCLHTEELSDVRCSSIRLIKLRCVCPM